MTFSEYFELCDYWADNPPLDVVAMGIAQALGMKPPQKRCALAVPEETPQSLSAMFPDGIIR